VFQERHRNNYALDSNRSVIILPQHKVVPDEDGTLPPLGDDYWRTEDLVSMLLKVAKQQAEAMAEEKVKDAVITVPAWFTNPERQAMLDSAELAGLNVLRLISSVCFSF